MITGKRLGKYMLTLGAMAVMAAGVVANAYADEQKEKEKKKPKPIPVYLGHSEIYDAAVSKRVFDSLLRQGLTSRDSAGKEFRVDGFLFTYGERNLYEDSVGKLMVLTDLRSEFCYGDTLRADLLQSITERTKAGDTVYIDQISLHAPEGYAANGRGMRIVISK